jgi:predicted amidohydrolase
LPIDPPHADAYTATVDGSHLNRTSRRGLPGTGGDDPAPRHLTVAAAQFPPVHGDVPANLSRIGRLLHRAAGQGADLVVFPELATTGYYWPSAEAIAPYAETVPGPSTRWLARQCRELGCHVICGLAERGGGARRPPRSPAAPGAGGHLAAGPAPRRQLFNTAVLVGPDGLAGRYRKASLWSWDTLWATAGARPPTAWPTPLGRIGALICADLDYPEGTSWLAAAGADLVAVPTCWSEEPTPSPVWRSRAGDNGLPFVVANVSGAEQGAAFSGGSCVIDSGGRVLDWAQHSEALAIATVDLSAGRERRRRRGAELAWAASDACEALDRNAQLFPPGRLPRARPRPAVPVPVAIVQATAGADARQDLASLGRQLASARPAGPPPALAVLPTLITPDLEGDSGLLPRLALACRDCGPADVVLSVLDARTGRTVVALAAAGAIVTCYQVDPDGLRSGDGAPLRPVARPWGALGLLTATELLRPEPARCLAINGADLIAATGRLARPPVEVAGPHAPALPPRDLWRVRAGENNCYLAVANATLPGGGGMSAIHGPDHYDHRAARVVLAASRPASASLALALDPATPSGRLVAEKPLLAQRRPELYARPR